MSGRAMLTTRNSEIEPEELISVRCLKSEGRQSVTLMQQPCGRLITVKREQLSFSLLWRSCLGITNSQRQERGSRRLIHAGIPTPEILNGTRFRFTPIKRQELILEYVSGENAWDYLSRQNSISTESLSIAARLGDLVATMVRHGLRNRDFKLENIILTDDEPRQISLIDTVGVRRAFFRVKALAQMLERLIVQPYYWRLSVPPGLTICLVRHALQPFPPTVRKQALRKLRARLSRISRTEIP